MLSDLKELFRFRELLWVWTVRNIRVRYKQSVLGIAWAILQPLALMIIFSLVFTLFVRVDTGGIPYPVFSYAALLPWTFFSGSISLAATSLTNNTNLVTKVYFPREIMPISVVIAGFVDFLIAFVIFIGMLLFYRIQIGLPILIYPILILIQVIMTIGITMLTSALDVSYRDIRFILPLGIQLWMFATPIIYPVSSIPEAFRPYYMLNPMAGLIEAYRSVAIQAAWPNWTYLGISAVVAVLIFFIGYRVFKKLELQFADII
jgi:lipopolysaccharide transport system permease protein